MRDTLRDTLRETLFSDFARTLLIISSQIKKFPILAVLQKKKYWKINIPTSTFQIVMTELPLQKFTLILLIFFYN